MLKTLIAKHFVVFQNLNAKFSPQFNIIAGETGSGKSVFLKLAAAAVEINAAARKEKLSSQTKRQQITGQCLSRVFKTGQLGCLIAPNKNFAVVEAGFGGVIKSDIEFSLKNSSVTNAQTANIYFSENSNLAIRSVDCAALAPELRVFQIEQPQQQQHTDKTIQAFCELTKKTVKGEIICDDPNYPAFVTSGNIRKSAFCLSEGFKRLCALSFLVKNIGDPRGAILFWDTPEAFLDNAMLRDAVNLLKHLSLIGAQIFIATHSLFLLREFYCAGKNNQAKFFGLCLAENGAVKIDQTSFVEDCRGANRLLEAELKQNERYMSGDLFKMAQYLFS